MVIVLDPLAPCGRVPPAGFADSAKSDVPLPLTVKASCAVRVIPPPVPVTVKVEVPGAALDDTATASVLVVPVVIAGSSVAVTPAGTPLTVSATLPGEPLRLMGVVLRAVGPRGDS